jgi:nicotinamidase-related amidase
MSMTTNTYAADRTALLIVDPYNDFMSEGGKLFEATRETAEAVGFYDNMRRLVLRSGRRVSRSSSCRITGGERPTTKDGSI